MMESVLPAIVKSGDPEGELLKCASEHNLPIAQVEKLGQVFNTYKTLTGLSVQKNRGDSHSIVDVPSMVEKYASFNPKKVLKKQAAVEKPIEKYASSDGWRHMFDRDADSYTITTGGKDDMVRSLRGIMDAAKADIAGGVVSDNHNSYHEFHNMSGKYDITFDKKASAKLYREVEGDLRVVEEDSRQIAHEIKQAVAEKCASIMSKLNPDEGRWAEAVEDIYDVYGVKSANAIHTVENYFDAKRHRFTPADLTKRAAAQVVVEDRHGVFGDIEEIMRLDNLADRLDEGFFKGAATFETADELQDQYDKMKAQLADIDEWASRVSGDTLLDADGNPVLDSKGKPVYISTLDITRKSNMAKLLTSRMESVAKRRDALRDAETMKGYDLAYEKMPEDYKTVSNSNFEATKAGVGAAVSPVKSLIEGMKNPLYKAHSSAGGAFSGTTGTAKRLVDAIAGDRFNDKKKQINIGKAKTQAKMDAALQQLMLSDPVIAKADPTEVQDLFNSIKELSPVLATNPTLMGPTLKEALQVGGIPIQLLSEVAKFNESWHKSHGGNSKDDHEKNSYDSDR